MLIAVALAGCKVSSTTDSADSSTGTAAVGQASSQKRPLAAALNPAGWVAVQEPADPLLQGLTIPPDAPARGMWSAPANWQIIGVNQAVLPDGKVLTWGALPSGEQNGRAMDL